jgi:hypothetical protein
MFNEKGLPRLIRYVEEGTIPIRDCVSIFDESRNLVIINKDVFELLDDEQKETIIRTEAKTTVIRRA